MTDTSKAPIDGRFNAIDFHDSLIKSVQIDRTTGKLPLIRFTFDYTKGDNQFAPATLTFSNCAFADLLVDLFWLEKCRGAISSANCQTHSDWLRSILEKSGIGRPEGFLHFRFVLVEPSGTIEIIAEDFELAVE